PRSWSARQYEIASAQLASTLKICYKAKALNQSPEEDKSLGRRLGYELRQAIRHRQWEVAAELLSLKKQVWPVRWEDHLYAFFIKKHHSQS
ncbi:MAG: chondroitin polymerase, partial [Bacteroidetes bacterium]|nr:chondroitin polymerase [Bacteroidota bacterium]